MFSLKKKILILVVLILAIFNFRFLVPVHSVGLVDDVKTQIQKGSGEAEGTAPADPRKVITVIIQIVLGLVGTIFLVLVVFGGFNYLTAAGDEEKAKKGTTMITQALIGLIIVLLSYSITYFIGLKVKNVTSSQFNRLEGYGHVDDQLLLQ